MNYKNDCWRTKQLNSATYQEDLFYNSIIETVLDCFMPKWIIRANMFPLMNITQKPSYNWYCQFRWNANSVKFHIWPNDKKSGIWLKKNLSSEDVIEKQNLEWFSLERQFRRFPSFGVSVLPTFSRRAAFFWPTCRFQLKSKPTLSFRGSRR